MSILTRRARKAAERLLSANAKPVRALLLSAGRDQAPRWPDIVQIESTNLCNAKCVFCPRDEMHRRQGLMDFDLYRKIVDEARRSASRTCACTTTASRSSTRQLVEKVRYAKRRASPKSA